jgi:hypothetical protein
MASFITWEARFGECVFLPIFHLIGTLTEPVKEVRNAISTRANDQGECRRLRVLDLKFLNGFGYSEERVV